VESVEGEKPMSAPDSRPLLDLATDREATRRILYDLAVRQYFSAVAPAEAGDRTWYPPRSPEAASLAVHYLRGRWFVSWLQPDTAGLADPERYELLRVEPDPADPAGVVFVDL
jgi:hypothetical protein